MLRIIAIMFGIAFIFLGVAGFLPSFMPNGYLLGFFEVDTLHNMLYLLCGVLAIMAATRYSYAKLYFQTMGVLYALLTIAGFVTNGDLTWFRVHVNFADNLLHLCIAVAALYLGFFRQWILRRSHP